MFGYARVPLESVCDIYDGTHQTPHYKECGIPFVSVENINDLYATKKYIAKEDYEKNYKVRPQKDDVFMTRIGTIGACAVVDKNVDLAYYVKLALIRPHGEQVESKYVKYILESATGRKELRKRTLVNAVPVKINLGDIGKILVPVPPLNIQKQLTKQIENFDTLCNDLTTGLPAEIEARQKQYEYYRDKLLTFKELGA